MRLRDYELQAIRSAFHQSFARGDQLYLFGSRVDDAKKGGDIDLYIQTTEMDAAKLVEQKLKFLVNLTQLIGEQKIDVVLHRLESSENLPIYKVAQTEGVRLTMSASEKIASELEVCHYHAENLKWSMQEIAKNMPLTAEKLKHLSKIDRAIFDMFMGRFSKLQDAMGSKLFEMVLDALGEKEYVSVLDKYHRLQKLSALPDTLDWNELRKIRNHFAHDYPNEYELNAQTLNSAQGQAQALLQAFEQLQAFIAKHCKEG